MRRANGEGLMRQAGGEVSVRRANGEGSVRWANGEGSVRQAGGEGTVGRMYSEIVFSYISYVGWLTPAFLVGNVPVTWNRWRRSPCHNKSLCVINMHAKLCVLFIGFVCCVIFSPQFLQFLPAISFFDILIYTCIFKCLLVNMGFRV